MSIKTYCDRCGEDVSKESNSTLLYVYGKVLHTYKLGKETVIKPNFDVCQDCADSLEKWWRENYV